MRISSTPSVREGTGELTGAESEEEALSGNCSGTDWQNAMEPLPAGAKCARRRFYAGRRGNQ